jgi:hypothetical protein
LPLGESDHEPPDGDSNGRRVIDQLCNDAELVPECLGLSKCGFELLNASLAVISRRADIQLTERD